MPVVKMPDGQLVNMPDNPTPEQLEQFKQFSEPSMWETVKHKAKLFGSDVVKGVAGLPALAIDAASIDPTTGLPPKKFGGASKALQGFGEQPVTSADKWQSAGTQGVAGALAGPGGVAAPVRTAIGGLAGGMGGEVAGRMTDDNPIARLAGALVGGIGGTGAATFASRAAPQASTLARESLEGLSPDMLDKAKSFQELAGTKGVTMDLAQALEAVGAPANNLTTVRNVLATSRHGNRVQEGLRNQPTELEMLGDTTVAALPGNVRQADVAANNVQAAATKVIGDAKKARSTAWENTVTDVGTRNKAAADEALAKALAGKGTADVGVQGAVADMRARLAGALSGTHEPQDFAEAVIPLSKANAAAREAATAVQGAKQGVREAKAVPPQTVLEAASDLQKLVQASPNTGKATALARLQKSLFDPITEAPITDPKKLNDILTSEANKLKSVDLNSSGIDAGTAKWIGMQIQNLREKLGASFEPIREANKRYQQITKDVIDPLKQGPVGQFATPRGYKPDAAATQTKLTALLNKGEDPAAGGSNIRALAKELQKVDPEAFPDALKTYVSGKLGESLPATIGASKVTAGDAAGKVYTSLFANRNQWNGLRQAAAASAESLGQKPEDVVRGLENFAQITKALKNRVEPGGVRSEEVFKIAGQNYGADAMRIFGFLPFEKAARRMEDAVMAKTLTQFDRILTTPEGAAKLAELGKVPPMSGKALAIWAAMGAGASAEE